jgi:putative SOS response-associated peptidase YedK
MCGRFTLTDPDQDLAAQFSLPEIPEMVPRYNIAPTQQVAAVRVVAMPDSAEAARTAATGDARELAMLQWGLIPFWAKDPKIGARMINARSETVAEKPAFRAAFRRRRCLVVADGFYEWQKTERGKQPFYIHLRDRRPFAFAGLWEHWKGPAELAEQSTLGQGVAIQSCTLLTTAPNDLIRPLHNRMPVIVRPDDYDLWLDPEVRQIERLQPILDAYPTEEMVAYPVSRFVNKPGNDDPRCIEPQAESWYQRLPGL